MYQNEDSLLENQFTKKDHLRPLYDALVKAIVKKLPCTRTEIKKPYTSLNAKREYATIGIKSKEVRLAMDLEGDPDGAYFVKQTGIGCMPRISQMIKLTDKSQISDTLLGHLVVAFDRMK